MPLQPTLRVAGRLKAYPTKDRINAISMMQNQVALASRLTRSVGFPAEAEDGGGSHYESATKEQSNGERDG
jgi:hypothetical protein